MSFATLNGNNIFGEAVEMVMRQHPTANQINEFFGVDGVFTLFGGTRGRYFLIKGTLCGVDMPSLNAAEAVFDTSQFGNIADGVGRTLITTRGITYQNVVYRGDYEPEEGYPRPGVWPGNVGYVIRYGLVLHGNT